MPQGVELCALGLAHGLLEFVGRGSLHAAHGFEGGQKLLPRGRSYAGRVVELGVGEPFGAFLAVKFDGEAVHLVLHLGEGAEELAVGLQADFGGRETGEQSPRAVTVVLGQTGDGDVEAQFVVHHLPHHLHLAASAVGYDEVGQGLALVFETCVATAHHLLHRGVVVGPAAAVEHVFAVEAFLRFQPLEDDAGCHGVGSCGVRIVEKFDAQGQMLQPEVVLQLLHQPRLLLFGIEFLGLLEAVELVLLHVEPRQVEQLFLVAPLRHGLHEHVVGQIDVERHHHLVGFAAVAGAHLHNAEA